MGYSRAYPRVEKLILTNVETIRESGLREELSVGRTLNISEGGALIESTQAPPLTSRVSLRIAVKEHIVNVEGEVTHLNKNRDGFIEIGIKFLNLSSEDREILTMFISQINRND